MSLISPPARVRTLTACVAVGALTFSGCGVAAETTAATVNGETITDAQVEQAARVQAIGNLPLAEDDPVPLEVQRRALSFLIAGRLLQDEQADLNIDAPAGLADALGAQLQADPAFAKLSDGEQSDLVSTAVAVVPPQQGADGSQPPGVAAAIQQALVSDPAARATFRAEHPQMFRELCADIAQAQPDDADELNRLMAKDPAAGFEKFGQLNQCQTAAATNGLVPRSSPQWPTLSAVLSGPIDTLVGPIASTVANPDPAAQGGGDSISLTRWVRPTGSHELDDTEATSFVSSLDGEALLTLLALQPGSVDIDSRYGDVLTVGPPDGLQVARVAPNGSGAVSSSASRPGQAP